MIAPAYVLLSALDPFWLFWKENKLKLNFAILSSLATLLAISAPSAQAQERMKSGQWEVTITSEGKSSTNAHCIPPDQVRMGNGSSEQIRTTMEKGAAAIHCNLQDFKVDGDSISYTYACPASTTKSKTTYHGNSYESEIVSIRAGKEQTRQIKGRRLGDCAAGE
jgi:hypothetical protein